MAYHGRSNRERAGLISFVAAQKNVYPIQSLYDTEWKEDMLALEILMRVDRTMVLHG